MKMTSTVCIVKQELLARRRVSFFSQCTAARATAVIPPRTCINSYKRKNHVPTNQLLRHPLSVKKNAPSFGDNNKNIQHFMRWWLVAWGAFPRTNHPSNMHFVSKSTGVWNIHTWASLFPATKCARRNDTNLTILVISLKGQGNRPVKQLLKYHHRRSESLNFILSTPCGTLTTPLYALFLTWYFFRWIIKFRVACCPVLQSCHPLKGNVIEQCSTFLFSSTTNCLRRIAPCPIHQQYPLELTWKDFSSNNVIRKRISIHLV